MTSKAEGEVQPDSTQVPQPRRGPPPPPPKPRRLVNTSQPIHPEPPPAVRSKYLINDIPRGTTAVKLFNFLVAPPHWQATGGGPAQLQPQVQFSCVITDSRLDDELSVAVLEFTNTPNWLQQANLDPFGFPKKTTLGTLWRGVDTAERDERGQTEFIRAAIDDNLIFAETLAEFGDTDVNVQDNEGRTALHWACAKSLPNIVTLCLSVPGCDVGLRDQHNLTAFDIARHENDELISNLFYQSMLELDQTDPQGALLRVLTVMSQPVVNLPIFPGEAIFQPIEERNPALVAALIARGVDLTTRNSDGDTALHVAAAKVDNSHIASVLLAAGSDIDATGAGGATVLHRAASTADEEMVKVLLQGKPNLAVKDSNERTALHFAAQNGRRDIALLLLDYGADPTAKDTAGLSPLRLAEDIQDIGMVELLKEVLEVEVKKEEEVAPPPLDNVELSDDVAPTTIHQAARDGNVAAVLVFLQQGADVEVKGLNGQTPLRLAANNGHAETVTSLLANGANIDAVDKHGWTALHYAANNGHADTITALVANGANIEAVNEYGWTALHRAANNGHADTITALLANGANIEAMGEYGWTALHYAADNGHADTITALLANGANIEAMGEYGWTALHRAAGNGHADTVTALLANGANIEAVTENGRTALHGAAFYGHAETVTALLANGASIEAVDEDGQTALHSAASKGHAETVNSLLAGGAKIEVRSPKGTALKLALKYSKPEIAEILVAHGAQTSSAGRLQHSLLRKLGLKDRSKKA